MIEFVLRFRNMDFSSIDKKVALVFLIDKAFRAGLSEKETEVAISNILN